MDIKTDAGQKTAFILRMFFVTGNEKIRLFWHMNISCQTYIYIYISTTPSLQPQNVKIFSVCVMYTLCVKLNYISVGTATNGIFLHVGQLQ